jgi:hypothetical protein
MKQAGIETTMDVDGTADYFLGQWIFLQVNHRS